jgi:hypothetical protein
MLQTLNVITSKHVSAAHETGSICTSLVFIGLVVPWLSNVNSREMRGKLRSDEAASRRDV